MNSDWSTRPSPLMSASSIISSSSFCVNFIPASSQAIFKLSNDIEPDLSVRERERTSVIYQFHELKGFNNILNIDVINSGN